MNPEPSVAKYGTTELTELVYLTLRDVGVTRIDFFGRGDSCSRFLGMPVRFLNSIEPQDYLRVMVSFSGDIGARCQELYESGVDADQIVTLLQMPKHEARVENYG